jgi:DNA repair exonuclease SbcCD ATPase subunit
MKKIFAILTLVIISLIVIKAQTILTVTEQTHNMSKGQQNAFVITVPQYTSSDLKDEWESYLKDNGKAKIETNNGEVSALNLSIDKISVNHLNHYALVDDAVDGPKLVAFYAFNDVFVTSANNPVISNSIKKFMTDFANTAYIKIVNKELNTEQKKLKSLKSDLSDMEEDENDSRQNIQDYKTKIEKTNNELAINTTAQQQKQQELDRQQQKMSDINMNADEKKLQNKQVENLQDDKKSLMKKEGNLKSDIEDYNNKINVEQNKMPGLHTKQITQKDLIQKQQEVVDKVAAKLDAIKKI